MGVGLGIGGEKKMGHFHLSTLINQNEFYAESDQGTENWRGFA